MERKEPTNLMIIKIEITDEDLRHLQNILSITKSDWQRLEWKKTETVRDIYAQRIINARRLLVLRRTHFWTTF